MKLACAHSRAGRKTHKHAHLYSPRVLDMTGRAELRTKMDTQQPMIYISEQKYLKSLKHIKFLRKEMLG